MNHNTDTAYTFLVGGGFSATSFLIGGIDNLVISLVILMSVDYVTGLMIGFQNKKLSSQIGFKGLMKKASMIFAIIMAVQLDNMSGNTGGFMRNAMIMYLIGLEGLSLIENFGNLGLKLPTQISSAFTQLKNDNDQKPPKSGDK